MPLPIYSQKSSKITCLIGVAAGKGGVGKSTISVQLAHTIKELGYTVGILDADLYGPSLRHMLPEETPPIQTSEGIQPAISMGLKTISLAHFRKDHEAAIVRAPIANGIIKQFLTDVLWGNLDFLFIDFPPGTGDIQLTISQQARLTGTLLVTTPQQISLLDVRKAANMFLHVNVPVLGIIENMSYYLAPDPIYLFGKGGGAQLAEELGVALLGKIPIDSYLSEIGDQGKLLMHCEAPKTSFPTLKAFDHIAKELIRKLEDTREKRTLPKKFYKKDRYTLTIEWEDGKIKDYSFNDLQKQCPCAACREKIEPRSQQIANVEVKHIKEIGRYALQFDFNSGCSAGIYTYDLLY